MNVPNGTNRVGKPCQTSSYKLQENIKMQDTSMIMSVWFSGFNFSSFAQILDLSTALKVSKYQKPFFLKLHCQKTNEILDKILLYEARAEFCPIFHSFFGQWSFKKNCF